MMNKEKMKTALQDLIYRLQDAEKGYKELLKASADPRFTQWSNTYANERHRMHQKIEQMISKLGGNPEVDTTILGTLHRLFIDIKINNTTLENQFGAIIDEIERGATTLINDYEQVLKEVEFPAEFVNTLMDQKLQISNELKSMKVLRALEKQSLVL